MTAARIAVLGSLNMDLVVRTPRLPQPGETLAGREFLAVPGGKGANQAVAAARLGAAATLIGCIGADAFGVQMREALTADGVDLAHLDVTSSLPTGVAVILVGADGGNCIVPVLGANAAVTPDSVDRAAHAIAQADMMVCQLETPLPTVRHSVELARRHGRRIVLNPAPAQALDGDLLGQIDFLIPNETEAALLAGVEVTSIATAEIAAGRLRGQGARVVLLTLGANGVLIADDAGIRLQPAPAVTAVDATAAGDTFVGAFAVAIAEGKPLADAVGFGQRAAALSVTRLGAQTSIPYRKEVDAWPAHPRDAGAARKP